MNFYMTTHKTSVIYLTLILLFSKIGLSQTKQGIDYIKQLPAFSMYGDNYFVTGTSLNKNGFRPETSDAKFEVGFKQRLDNVALPFGVFPFLAYRQKAFWDIYLESSPFRELNYNPSVGFVKLFANESGITDGVWFALEHESNGRDEENSRSWNFFSLTYFRALGKQWQLISKVWLPVGNRSGNEDITSYRGYFSIGASYKPVKNTFIDVHIQPAFKNRLTGFIKLALSFKIAKHRNQFLHIQYFGGYSEDLINYNEFSSNLRIGIVFKDLFANFE